MSGLIQRSVQNPILGNLLMFGFILAGILSVTRLRRETFPNFSLDRIEITVVRQGASPEDIEESISIKTEEAIQGIEGIRTIESTSREGRATVVAELYPGMGDPQQALDEIRTRVERLEFPEDAEKPVITEIKRVNLVIQVAVYGEDLSAHGLKDMAEEVRGDLLDLPGVSQVEIVGTRPYEVSIDLSPEMLRRLGISMEEVVARVRAESLDLPGGSIRSDESEILIRTEGMRRSAREYEAIVLVARPDGTAVTLGQVARVRDDFEEVDRTARFDGHPAVFLLVFKTDEEDMISISREVRGYVAARGPDMPRGIRIDAFNNVAAQVEARLSLLLINGIEGMILVFLVLWFFMGLRLSLWVALGVPVSFLGTLFILYLHGGTLNLSSMFAFIMALGMIVDDAIVISENVYVHYLGGKTPVQAAIDGTREMAMPVMASSCTTALAFVPLYLAEGRLGKLMVVIPVIVIGALAVSLVESLLILPPHLAHSLPSQRRRHRFDHLRRKIESGTRWATERMYIPLLGVALRSKWAVIGLAVGSVLVAAGLLVAGKVKFTAFARADSDFVRARFELPPGTPLERAEAVADALEDAAARMESEVGEGLVLKVSTILGQFSDGNEAPGSHLGEVNLELAAAEDRPISSDEVLLRWRESTGAPAEVERLIFEVSTIRAAAKPFEVQIVGDDLDAMREASRELQAELASFPGVIDIADDDRLGKVETRYTLKPEASVFGITVADVAQQLRQGYFGTRTLEIQRGREEVGVIVRYPPEDRRRFGDLDEFRIRTPTGQEVPLRIVADQRLERGVAVLRRVDRRRVITVTAEVDPERANSREILETLQAGFLADLERDHPGVGYRLDGQSRQTAETLGSLFKAMAVAFLAIYGVLCLVFRSWLQPLVILAAIPLTLFGVAFGHYVMAFDITLMSLAGLIALAGIVINDSLVLVESFNEGLSRQMLFGDALLEAGRSRLRPILLTSLTTTAGLLPMLLERSIQAKYLIPMAIAVSFGLLFATLLILFVIPSLLSVVNDGRRVWFWLWNGRFPTPEEVEPAVSRERHREQSELVAALPIEMPEEIGPVVAAAALPSAPAEGPAEPLEAGNVTRILGRGGDVEQLLARAEELRAADDPRAAADHYAAAARREPERADLHLRLGMARFRLGQWPGAAASFDRAHQLDPSEIDHLFLRGRAHLLGKEYAAAREDFSLCLEASPDHLLALKARACAAVGLERYSEAIDDFSLALEIAPQNADAFFLRGDARQRAGNHMGAIADFDRALDRRPEEIRSLLGRGISRIAIGDQEGARADLTRVLELDPDHSGALEHRGRAALRMHDHAAAERDLSEFLSRCPDRHDVLLGRGRARARLGDPAGAASDFQTYLQHHPRSPRRRSLERFVRDQLAEATRSRSRPAATARIAGDDRSRPAEDPGQL